MQLVLSTSAPPFPPHPPIFSPQDLHIKQFDAHCLLRPEAVESWFVLHRVTGEARYREWGWDLARALERHTRVDTGGYSSLDNVLQAKNPGRTRDKMESFFLAVRWVIPFAVFWCLLKTNRESRFDFFRNAARHFLFAVTHLSDASPSVQETLKYLVLLFSDDPDVVRAIAAAHTRSHFHHLFPFVAAK